MIKIDLLHDEELQNAINSFISAMLPHSKYSPEYFTQNLNTILKYIHLDEMQMEYGMIVKVLSDLNKIKASLPNYQPSLTKDTLEKILETSLLDAVVRPELGVQEWLDYEGVGSDLSNEKTRMEASQKLYQRTMELYELCWELEQDSAEAINGELELKAAFVGHVAIQTITTQTAIIQHGARVGRKRLRGFQDWFDYNKAVNADLESRLSEANDTSVVLSDVASSLGLLRKLNEFWQPIANYGIPPLDARTPILGHRLIVIVGGENIGKTRMAIDQSVNVLLAGGKVVYMCGEAQPARVYADILINYIYKKHGVKLLPQHLSTPEECPQEIQMIISMAIDEVVTKQALIFTEAFNYATVYEEMVSLYEQHHFDAVVIDHSCALKGTYGGGSLKEKVDKLSDSCRKFKYKYPVAVIVTSHPSSVAKEQLRKGLPIDGSPTRESQNLSTDADEVFVLRDNPVLRKQELIQLENTKRRDASVLTQAVILRKHFDVSHLEYVEALQAPEEVSALEKQEALRVIDEEFSEYMLDD